jgi:hypothetical protein
VEEAIAVLQGLRRRGRYEAFRATLRHSKAFPRHS